MPPAPALTRRTFGALPFVCAAAGVVTLSAAAVFAPVLLRARAQPAALGRVRLAVGGLSVLYHLPLALADSLGFFRAEGLDVLLRDQAAGALALRAVHSGAADVCVCAFEHTLRAQALGQPLRALVLYGRAPQLALGVSLRALPGYRTLADLAGRRIGVSSIGSGTHLAASSLLLHAGVAPQAARFVAVGAGAQALQALRSGQVQALCHADPVMTLLEQKADTRIVGDLRSLKAAQQVFGGTMPAGALCAPEAFVRQQRAQVQALVNAMVRALKWLQTAAPADLVKALPAAWQLGDRGLYLAAFGRVRETYATNGLMPEGGPETALRALARVQPDLAASAPNLARSYSNDFVQQARKTYNV